MKFAIFNAQGREWCELVIAYPATGQEGRAIRLALDGIGEVSGNTDEYPLFTPHILAFVSAQITLFPGDVSTLGRIASRLEVSAEQQLPANARVPMTIEGIGTVTSPVSDERLSAAPTTNS